MSYSHYPFGALPARHTGCQLFLPLPRNPRVCLVCGGGRPQHAPSRKQGGSHRDYLGLNGMDSALNRPLNCTYDIRAEFVPKNSFKSKFGPCIPIVVADDNYCLTSGHNDSMALSTSDSNSDVSADDKNLDKQEILKNPTFLSPSASSAFENYHMIKNKNSAQSSPESSNGKVKCCHTSSDSTSNMENGHSSTSLGSDLSLTLDDGNYDSLPEIPPIEQLHNFNYEPFQMASCNSDEENIENHYDVGTIEREIDKEIDKIFGNKDNKPEHNSSLASQVMIPMALKPLVSHNGIILNKVDRTKLKPGPLMKSQSECVPAISYTLSIKNDSLVNKTTISIKGENEASRPQSAQLPIFMNLNTDDTIGISLSDSNNHNRISSMSPPSLGRALSDFSSNLSTTTETISSQSDEGHGKQQEPLKLALKEVQPMNCFSSFSGQNKVAIHILESEEAQKRPPMPPQRVTPVSPTQNYAETDNGTNYNYSSAVVPQLSLEETMIDTRVCQHLNRQCPVAFLQQNKREDMITQKPNKVDSPGGMLSGLKRFLPNFEAKKRSISHSAPGDLQKQRTNISKSSMNISTGIGTRKSKFSFGGSRIKGFFHSVDDACSATDNLTMTKSENSVVVTEILEPVKVTSLRQKQTEINHRPHLIENQSNPSLLHPPKKHDGLLKPNQEFLTVYKRNGSYQFKTSTDTVNSSIFSYEEHGPLKEDKKFHFGQPQKNLTGTHLPSSEKRKQMEDRYNQMALSHLSMLSFLADYFEESRKKAKNLEKWANGDVNVSWSDFVLADKDSPILLKEMGIFYKGIYMNDSHEVSPLRYSHPSPRNGSQIFFLPVIAEFQDNIPNKHLQNVSLENDSGSESVTGSSHGYEIAASGNNTTLCRVSVFPEGQLFTIDSFADATASGLKHPHIHEKEICFIMIQLLSCLKFLQSQGIEDIRSDLDCFLIIIYPNQGLTPHLVLLWESLFLENADDSSSMRSRDIGNLTLCQCGLGVLCMLFHSEVPFEEIFKEHHIPLFPRQSPYSAGFQKVADILNQEKTSSLHQAKNLLDYMYWMASFENSQSGHVKFDNEFSVRLWLDVERARTVNQIVRSVMQNNHTLDLTDQYRLQFLLNGSVKQLWEAACTYNANHDIIV